jgi:hypothetical protein
MSAQIRLTQNDGVELALNVDSIEVVMVGTKYNDKQTTLVGMKSGRNFNVLDPYAFVADAVSDLLDQEAGRI